jgi:hypothetical protein
VLAPAVASGRADDTTTRTRETRHLMTDEYSSTSTPTATGGAETTSLRERGTEAGAEPAGGARAEVAGVAGQAKRQLGDLSSRLKDAPSSPPLHGAPRRRVTVDDELLPVRTDTTGELRSTDVLVTPVPPAPPVPRVQVRTAAQRP